MLKFLIYVTYDLKEMIGGKGPRARAEMWSLCELRYVPAITGARLFYLCEAQ